MNAAIYCRVSTEDQEREGTSLQTQLDNCLAYCRDKGYNVAYRYSEAYSGLSLDRPQLNELRELVRNEQLDVVVVYCLDRLSRNATHGVIIRDELDKYHVLIESVTEDIDKTPLGEAITYLRGTFSQIEAEKIKERTMRGKKARAREGRMSGGFYLTYGYDYIPVSQVNGGRRVINEIEAEWVRQMFNWLVNDGITAGAIRNKLTALNLPTKKGGQWSKVTVLSILKNPAYTGKTYAFTSIKQKPRSKPQEEWIEIPGVTPAIISKDVFDAAQRQLQINRAKAMRNTKREYLLRGHVKCRQCGHAYVGGVVRKRDLSYKRLYRCTGKWKDRAPFGLCRNKSWGADKLEALVWAKLEAYLSNRDLIANELGKQRHEADQLGVLELELERLERQLTKVDRDQHQLLQWALKGFPEAQVEAENRRLNKARKTLKVDKAELETQTRVARDAVISVPQLEQFIDDIQSRIFTLDYEGKRQVFDMSVLFAHNHPSGDPEASEDDVNLTRRLVEAGEIMGIDVLDHVIIGEQNFLSFKREGLF
jgi:site-specific DNA recombinase